MLGLDSHEEMTSPDGSHKFDPTLCETKKVGKNLTENLNKFVPAPALDSKGVINSRKELESQFGIKPKHRHSANY